MRGVKKTGYLFPLKLRCLTIWSGRKTVTTFGNYFYMNE